MNTNIRRKLLLGALLLGLGSTSLSAQDGWTEKTTGSNDNINSIYFTSASIGFAVGTDGLALKTGDGGNNWSSFALTTSNSLNTVFFESSTVGYAGDQTGKIHRTTDGGSAWSPISVSVGGINAIDFSGGNGVAVGDNGTVFSTTDGTSWTEQSSLGVFAINDVAFLNDTAVVAVGSGGDIHKSMDAGLTWTSMTSGTSNALSSVVKLSDTEAIVSGVNGTILNVNPFDNDVSTEGLGVSSEWLKSVDCSSTGVCYAGGSNSTFLIRHAAGGNWVNKDLDSAININAVHFPTGTTGYVAGISGKLFKSTSSGFPISAEELTTVKSASVVPNPVVDEFSLQGFNGNFEIYNSLGSLIISGNTELGSINFSDAHPGLYFVKLYNSNGSQTLRFIKQ